MFIGADGRPNMRGGEAQQMDFRVSARGGIWNVVRRWRISFFL